MKKKNDDRVFKIDPATAPFGFRNSVSRMLVEHMVGLPKLDNILRDGRKIQAKTEGGGWFVDFILSTNMAISSFDQSKKDEGYACLLEYKTASQKSV